MTVPLTFVLGVLGILIGKHFYRTCRFGKEDTGFIFHVVTPGKEYEPVDFLH